ncbi:MAG TPA: hypothetical protein VD884_19040 [Ohtaekwangia sp.]|nr:hypothetical protein [Ohtaekwangia sp.]
MKHIKRKFTHQVVLSEEVMTKVNSTPSDKSLSISKALGDDSIASEFDAWIITDKNYCAKGFRYKSGGSNLLVPEPEPVLVYFNIAQTNYSLIETHGNRQKLLELLKEFKDATKIMHSLYAFMGYSSSFAIFSFMAIECLANRVIPDNYLIRNELKLKTEEFNIDQIQQFEFLKKIKDILPEVTGKKFWKDHPVDYQRIIDLKDFRNEIVHTKKQVKDETYYRKLFIKALDLDYAACLESVKNFINYYQKDLVEECKCGADF